MRDIDLADERTRQHTTTRSGTVPANTKETRVKRTATEIMSDGKDAEEEEAIARGRLVRCSDCGNEEVSKSAPACPRCGAVRVEHLTLARGLQILYWVFTGAMLIVVLVSRSTSLAVDWWARLSVIVGMLALVSRPLRSGRS